MEQLTDDVDTVFGTDQSLKTEKKLEKSWAELCSGSKENSLNSSTMEEHSEVPIELFDVQNDAKYEKMVKNNSIDSIFTITSVKPADPIIPNDPSILAFKLGVNQSLEEGELEQTVIEDMQTSQPELFLANTTDTKKEVDKIIPKPEELCTSKRKHIDVDDQSFPKKSRAESVCSDSSTGSALSEERFEKDQEILIRRQKQIDFGKNTIGYDNYIKQVPKALRTKEQPKTPPRHLKYSRRAWDGLVKKWRIQLHEWDSFNKKELSNNYETH